MEPRVSLQHRSDISKEFNPHWPAILNKSANLIIEPRCCHCRKWTYVGGFCGRAGDWVTWPGARFAPFYSYPIIRRRIELFYMTKTWALHVLLDSVRPTSALAEGSQPSWRKSTWPKEAARFAHSSWACCHAELLAQLGDAASRRRGFQGPVCTCFLLHDYMVRIVL